MNRKVLEQVFHVMDQAFDYLVMDLSLVTGDVGAFLLDRTDQMCVVVDPTPQGLARTGHLLGLMRGAQVPPSAIGLCVNRTTDTHTGAGASQLGPEVLAYLGDQPQTVAWVESKGRTLMELRPDDELAAGFADLSRTFIQRAFRHRTEGAKDGGADIPSDVRRDLKLRILRRLIEEIDLRKGDLGYLHDPVKRQEMHVRVEGKLVALVQEEATEVTRQDRRQLVKELMDEALGLGPLEDLLDDPTVTEIMVNRIDQVYVERKGKLTLSHVSFLSNDQLRGIIERIVAPLGRRIDEKVPMVDARLRDGSRVNAIIPPLALQGPGHHHPQVLEEAAGDSRPDRLRLDDRADGHLPRRRRPRAAEHRHLRRHRLGQDHAAQRAVVVHPRRRAHRHHRGRRRAAAAAGARRVARDAPAEHRGRGRDHHPRPGAQLAAHAPRSHRRRRVPRRRGARHAAGDEHRPRRLAHDAARQHPGAMR